MTNSRPSSEPQAAPKTEAALAEIHGIGPKKLAQYGEALLDLVRQNG